MALQKSAEDQRRSPSSRQRFLPLRRFVAAARFQLLGAKVVPLLSDSRERVLAVFYAAKPATGAYVLNSEIDQRHNKVMWTFTSFPQATKPNPYQGNDLSHGLVAFLGTMKSAEGESSTQLDDRENGQKVSMRRGGSGRHGQSDSVHGTSLDEDRPHFGRSGLGPDRPATSRWAVSRRQGVGMSARGFVRDGNQGTASHHEMVSGKVGLFRWIVDFRVDRDDVRHARGFSFEIVDSGSK